MEKLITPEIISIIGKLLVDWGLPGIFIVWLLDERRRLLGDNKELQQKYSDSLEARINVQRESLTIIKDNENAFARLDRTVDRLVANLGYRKGREDA